LKFLYLFILIIFFRAAVSDSPSTPFINRFPLRLVVPLCTALRPLLVVSVPPFAKNASSDGPYTPLLIFTNLPHPNPIYIFLSIPLL